MPAPKISVCHATARPNGWQESAAAWLKNAVGTWREDLEYVLSYDPRKFGAFLFPQSFLNGADVYQIPDDARLCSVDNWNHAVSKSTGKVIILNADDFFPPENWDEELLKEIPDLDAEFVVHVATGNPDQAWEDRLIPLGILSRTTLKRWGYALHPGYESMYSDVEMTERAYKEGIVIEARRLTFEHRHFTFGKAIKDDVYAWQNRQQAYEEGLMLLDQRRAAGFP
jgi:hypothetical protein